jgi:transporter family-2 protein
MPTELGLLLLTGLGGVSFVFQQTVSANLRLEIGSPWWAGFISYLGGTVVMCAVALALREPWASQQQLAGHPGCPGPAASSARFTSQSQS